MSHLHIDTVHMFFDCIGNWRLTTVILEMTSEHVKVDWYETAMVVQNTRWAKKVIPLVHILHCTRGITFLAHPVDVTFCV